VFYKLTVLAHITSYKIIAPPQKNGKNIFVLFFGGMKKSI
jgi:hypothetical protein